MACCSGEMASSWHPQAHCGQPFATGVKGLAPRSRGQEGGGVVLLPPNMVVFKAAAGQGHQPFPHPPTKVLVFKGVTNFQFEPV